MGHLAFRKSTPEGLSVDVAEFEGIAVLLLTKGNHTGMIRWAQIMGLAGKEVSTPTDTWYYEFEALPHDALMSRLARTLIRQGYTVGTFDQHGNFRDQAR